jgi:tight adherence protein B
MSSTALLWAVPVACFGAASVLFSNSVPQLYQRHRIKQQLGEIGRRTPTSGISADDSALLLRPIGGSGIWAHIFARFSALAPKQRELRRAGLEWTVERYMLMRAVFAILAFIFAAAFFRSLLLAVIGAALGAMLPAMHVRRLRNKRVAMFEDQLPGAIDLMARAMRAGHPFVHSLEVVAQDAPEPLATEFRLAYDEHRFGMPLDEAMMRLSERLELPDAQILITAILVQRDAGGNIAEVFGRLSALIRERSVLTRQVRIHTAEGRMSGYLLSALPIAVGLMFLLFNPDYIMTLGRDPFGRVLLGIAVVFQLIGHFWIQKIVRVEV